MSYMIWLTCNISSNLDTEINGGMIIEGLLNRRYTKKPSVQMDLYVKNSLFQLPWQLYTYPCEGLIIDFPSRETNATMLMSII